MNNYHRYIELPFTVPMPDQFNLPAKDFISYVGQDAATLELKVWLSKRKVLLKDLRKYYQVTFTRSQMMVKYTILVHNTK